MKEVKELIRTLENIANPPNETIDQMLLGGRLIHKEDLRDVIYYLKEYREIEKSKEKSRQGADRPDEYACGFGLRGKNWS